MRAPSVTTMSLSNASVSSADEKYPLLCQSHEPNSFFFPFNNFTLLISAPPHYSSLGPAGWVRRYLQGAPGRICAARCNDPTCTPHPELDLYTAHSPAAPSAFSTVRLRPRSLSFRVWRHARYLASTILHCPAPLGFYGLRYTRSMDFAGLTIMPRY